MYWIYPCYLQQCHSIDLFSDRTPGHSQKDHMNKVCPSFWSFYGIGSLGFFWELDMVLGAHVVLCMTEPDFLKIMFSPHYGKNRPSPGYFQCIGKFNFFSQLFIFLSIWSVILVCLNKFHIWENSGSSNMAQNALDQSDCRIFQSIAGL